MKIPNQLRRIASQIKNSEFEKKAIEPFMVGLFATWAVVTVLKLLIDPDLDEGEVEKAKGIAQQAVKTHRVENLEDAKKVAETAIAAVDMSRETKIEVPGEIKAKAVAETAGKIEKVVEAIKEHPEQEGAIIQEIKKDLARI